MVSTSNKNWGMVFDMCGFKDTSAYLSQLRVETPASRNVMVAQEIANQSLRGRVLEKIQTMIIEREKLFETTVAEDEATLLELNVEFNKQAVQGDMSPTSPAGQLLRQMNIALYRYFNKNHVTELKKMYQGLSDDSEADVTSSDIDEEAIEAAVLAAAAAAAKKAPVSTSDVANLAAQWELNRKPDRDTRLAVDLDLFNQWFQAGIEAPAVCKIEAKMIPGFRIGTVVTEDVTEEDIYLTVPKNMI